MQYFKLGNFKVCKLMLYVAFFDTQNEILNVKRWIFSGMRVEETVVMQSIEKRTRKGKMETRTLGKI